MKIGCVWQYWDANPHKEEEEVEYSSVELLDMLHNSFQKSDELLLKLREELR